CPRRSRVGRCSARKCRTRGRAPCATCRAARACGARAGRARRGSPGRRCGASPRCAGPGCEIWMRDSACSQLTARGLSMNLCTIIQKSATGAMTGRGPPMAEMAVYNAASDLIDRNIRAGRGDKPAFIDRQRRLSYAELARETARAANLMAGLGLRREDRVALVLLDTVDFPVLFLGAIRAGVVPVPLNTLLTAEQYAYILADTRARIA